LAKPALGAVSQRIGREKIHPKSGSTRRYAPPCTPEGNLFRARNPQQRFCHVDGPLLQRNGIVGSFLTRYNVSHEESMAATEMVHVRVEKRIKAQAAKTLAAIGLSLSDAVRVLLTRVAVEKALPFEVKLPNAKTAAAMQEARKGGLRSFNRVSDLMSDLDAED